MDKAWNETLAANIRIYPPELGQVIAKLKMTGKNEATLDITSENSRVRDIIEASLPQLKSQFQQAGINIQTVTVDVQPSLWAAEQNQQFNQKHKEPVLDEEVVNPREKEHKEKLTATIDSIIDTYA
jgi:flagellar hook-length control protein FliK